MREAVEGDIDGVLEIERESFPNPWPREELERRLGSGIFLVYDRGGRVLGYLVASRCRSPIGGPFIHLENLAVRGDARRRGIASALLRELISLAGREGLRRILLEVREGNEAALGLYRKFGFTERRKLLSFYSDGEDALLLELQLPGP